MIGLIAFVVAFVLAVAFAGWVVLYAQCRCGACGRHVVAWRLLCRRCRG